MIAAAVDAVDIDRAGQCRLGFAVAGNGKIPILLLNDSHHFRGIRDQSDRHVTRLFGDRVHRCLQGKIIRLIDLRHGRVLIDRAAHGADAALIIMDTGGGDHPVVRLDPVLPVSVAEVFLAG